MPLPVHLNIPLQNNCSGGESEGDTAIFLYRLSRYPAALSIMQYLYGDWCYRSTKPFLNMVALKGSNYLAQKC